MAELVHPGDCPVTLPYNHRRGTPGCVAPHHPADDCVPDATDHLEALGWDPHDDSCECHIGICGDCGCTNEMPKRSISAVLRRAVLAEDDWQAGVQRDLQILHDIAEERVHQERIGAMKRAAGIDWRSCADPDMAGGDPMRYLVLGEEVGEVARALLERGFVPKHLVGEIDAIGDPDLRAELIQVAAVAVAWVEAIDTRGKLLAPVSGSVQSPEGTS